VEIDVTPALAEPEHRALLAALADPKAGQSEDDPYGQAWRVAGLRERTGDDADYAFSPRSTRGATRA